MRANLLFQQIITTWGTADEVRVNHLARVGFLADAPGQVNCPKAGVAFYNKLQIEDKKLVEYDVSTPRCLMSPSC